MAFIDITKIPATGHPRIDAGHRAMAEAVNRLYEHWQNGASQEEVVRHLEDLLRVVGRHFAEEEDIGRAAGYDAVEDHARRHRDLMDDLTGLVDRVRGASGYGDLTIDAFGMIDSLLYEHEIVDDQDYWLLFRDGPPKPATGRPLIVWDERLETGIDSVDEEHRQLVDLLNRLSSALEEGVSTAAVQHLLNAVLTHTRAHFAAEEGLMEAAGSPSRESHSLLHDALIADLETVIAQHADGKYGDLEDLLQTYLKFWLIDHIRNVDARTLPGARGATVREDAEPGAG